MNARLATFVRYDHALSCACNRASAAPLWRRVFAAVSRLGDGLFWYALMAALPVLYGAKAWPLVGAMALNGVALTLAYKWLKAKTRRLRPCDAHPALRRDVAPLDRFSFPSGHTLHAVAFSELVIAVHPEWAWLLAPFTVLVALSRLVLGLHYPSDVLAGAGLGALFATITLLLCGLAPP